MRYKEFNKNRVLEHCISLFWQNGFGSCSINDIVRNTKVNRFSLYNEFDNKNGILFATLDLYNQRYSKKRIAILNDNDQPQQVLERFFKSYFEQDTSHPSGCFTIHIATELADHDEAIKTILDQYLSEIEEAFIILLNKWEAFQMNSPFIAKHLIGLFCNSMCYCVIQTPEEQFKYIGDCLDLVLIKTVKNGEIVK